MNYASTAIHAPAARRFSLPVAASAGIAELKEGLHNWRIWHMLGIGELRRRYARTWGGQFWQTLSTGISAAIMGVMWSVLWKQPVAELMPYLVTSLIIWQLLSGIVGESITVFSGNQSLLLGYPLPMMTVVLALIYKNLLIFAHNAVVILLVLFVFRRGLSLDFLLIFPALALICVTGIWFGFLCGAVCARFRDLSNVVQIGIQLAFYVSPVIWKPEFIGPSHHWMILVNPFAVLLENLRSPFLGQDPSGVSWLIGFGVAFGGLAASLPLIGHYRRRIAFWL